MCLRDATLARQCVLCRTPAIAVEYSESACSLCTGQGMCSLVLALNSELELEFQRTNECMRVCLQYCCWHIAFADNNVAYHC